MTSTIFIFEALFNHELMQIKKHLKSDENIILNDLDVNEIIKQIQNFIKDTNNTLITIYLIANITDDDERIFNLNETSLSIEDIINLLIQICYNVENIKVQFNKKVIFKIHRKKHLNQNNNNNSNNNNNNNNKKIIFENESIIETFMKIY